MNNMLSENQLSELFSKMIDIHTIIYFLSLNIYIHYFYTNTHMTYYSKKFDLMLARVSLSIADQNIKSYVFNFNI